MAHVRRSNELVKFTHECLGLSDPRDDCTGMRVSRSGPETVR